MAGKSEERNEIVIEINNTRKFFRLIEAIEFLEELAQMERDHAEKEAERLKAQGIEPRPTLEDYL